MRDVPHTHTPYSLQHKLLKKFGASCYGLSWMCLKLKTFWSHCYCNSSVLQFCYQVYLLLLVDSNTSYVIYTFQIELGNSFDEWYFQTSDGCHNRPPCTAACPEVPACQTVVLSSCPPGSCLQPPTPALPSEDPVRSAEPGLQWQGSSQPPVYPGEVRLRVVLRL